MTIRPSRPEDAPALAEVFRDAIATLGAERYTPAQLAAWRGFADEPGRLAAALAEGRTLVAEENGTALAFGQLHPASHVAMLYCRGTHARRGLATALYGELEAHARTAGATFLDTEASLLSQPFFERHGFALTGIERVTRHGVVFERFLMRKDLAPGSG